MKLRQYQKEASAREEAMRKDNPKAIEETLRFHILPVSNKEQLTSTRSNHNVVDMLPRRK